MFRKTEQDIFHYVDFLRDAGYIVMLSCMHPTLTSASPSIMNYEHHLCPVCIYVKNYKQYRARCLGYKELLINSENRGVIFNCCWAGVEEYIFPVLYHDRLLCRIHISGFRNTLSRSRRRSRVLMQRLGKEFTNFYMQLSDKVPTQQEMERLVNPFLYMFATLYEEILTEMPEVNNAASLCLKAQQYIYLHYMDHISIESIAQAINFSPSYLRLIFQQQIGKTVMEFVNEVRLFHAEDLLKFTSLPITKIAYDCGFRDSNYFSTAFKKHFGISPRMYRRKYTRV